MAQNAARAKVIAKLGIVLSVIPPCQALTAWAEPESAAGPERIGAGLVIIIGAALLAAATLFRRYLEAAASAPVNDLERVYGESEAMPEVAQSKQAVS